MASLAVDLRVNTRQHETRVAIVLELVLAPLCRRDVTPVAAPAVLVTELASMNVNVAGSAGRGGAAVANHVLGEVDLFRPMTVVAFRLRVRAGQRIVGALRMIERTNREGGQVIRMAAATIPWFGRGRELAAMRVTVAVLAL